MAAKIKAVKFNKGPSGEQHGNDFGLDVGFAIQDIPFNYHIGSVKGHVDWKQNDFPDSYPILKLKRGRLKERLIFGEIELAKFSKEHIANTPTRMTFDIERDDSMGFWACGDKGDSLGVYYDAGEEGSTVELIDLSINVEVVADDAGAGTVRAFVVGITEYSFFQRLNSAQNDSRAIRDLLLKHGLKLFKGFEPIETTIDLEDFRKKQKRGENEALGTDANIFYIENCHIYNFQKMYSHFLAAVKPGDVAFVFFAGHGCQFKNDQCLLARALLKEEREELEVDLLYIKQSSLGLQGIIDELNAAKAKTKVILLDCCREFKYKDKTPRAGLQPVKLKDKKGFNVSCPKGTVIGFATSPNDFSYEPKEKRAAYDMPKEEEEEDEDEFVDEYGADGTGRKESKKADEGKEEDEDDEDSGDIDRPLDSDRHSEPHGYYTQALLKHLATPDTDLDTILRHVGSDVVKASGGSQRPYRNSSINAESHYLFKSTSLSK